MNAMSSHHSNGYHNNKSGREPNSRVSQGGFNVISSLVSGSVNRDSSHGIQRQQAHSEQEKAVPQGGRLLGMLGLSKSSSEPKKKPPPPPPRQTRSQDAEKAEEMFQEGNDYAKQEQWVEALAFYNAVLVLQRRTIGKDHPNSGRTLNAIGVALTKKGDYYSGLTALEEALYVRQTALGEGHPDVIETVNNMNILLDLVHKKDGNDQQQQTDSSGTKPA